MIDIQKQPTEEQVQQFSEFLFERTNYSFITFIGFITSVIGGARVIPTAEWQEFFLKDSTFDSKEEEAQIKETMMIFYHLTVDELNREEYVPFTSQYEDHARLPDDTRKFVYLGWISGYCLGLTLAGDAWLNAEHIKAANLLRPIMEVCGSLDDADAFNLTREDLVNIQTHVKAFHDYWAAYHTREGKPETEVPNKNISKSEISY